VQILKLQVLTCLPELLQLANSDWTLAYSAASGFMILASATLVNFGEFSSNPSNLLSRPSLPSRLPDGGGGLLGLAQHSAVLENAAEHVGVIGQTMDTVVSLKSTYMFAQKSNIQTLSSDLLLTHSFSRLTGLAL
jgi:hypothetical protein